MRCQLYMLALLLAIQGHAKAQKYLEDGSNLLGKCKSTDAFFVGVCFCRCLLRIHHGRD
jgi:hypothetical protein